MKIHIIKVILIMVNIKIFLFKVVVILCLIIQQVDARKTVSKFPYSLTVQDVNEIAIEMKRLEVSELNFEQKYTFSNGHSKLTTQFQFDPYESSDYFEKSIILNCQKKDVQFKWECHKNSVLNISIEKLAKKNISVIDNYNLDINIFIEAAKVANNEKSMTMKMPIISIESLFADEFLVKFGKDTLFGKSCYSLLMLILEEKNKQNYFRVNWDGQLNRTCFNY